MTESTPPVTTHPAEHPESQAQRSTPVVPPAHRRTGLRSWWESASQWRNWRLPVKVAAVLAVPAIAAIGLGAVQIHGNVTQAGSYARIQRLIELRTALMPLTDDLQNERWLAAEKLGTTTKVDPATFDKQAAKVDKDAASAMSLGDKLLDPNSAAGIRYEGLVGQLAGLRALHQESVNGVDVITVISNYGQMISAVLDLDEALNTQLSDPGLTGTSIALYDIEVAHEQIRQQEAIGVVGIARGQLVDTELTTVRSSDVLLQDRLSDFQVVATQGQLTTYQQPSTTNDINDREQLAQALLSNGQTLLLVGSAGSTGEPLGVTASSWIGASDAAVTQLTSLESELADELRSTSAALQDDASDAAGIGAVVLFAILLLAVGVGIIVGRHLLRSLSILRKTALEVAEHQLPNVVADIERGKLQGLSIEPVPVHTHEELGQLARAFDAVHGQAVRSAVGQATLRSNLRNIFVNLSRRSQSLVERQLRLMEGLERNEEDPQQLANLFKLDHLATRMRRNNENLMVLSGDDPARRSNHPLPLADVLRAAVSEIEHYQRVLVRSTPSVDVLGYASGDLVRLIAELLDNAASFSPPQTQVRIGGRNFPDGSIQIEIRDLGIGLSGTELADANNRLNATETEDVPVSRQMGLYVVGRLARRHKIRVMLEPVQEGGLRAVVDVPAELVKASDRPGESTITGQTGTSLLSGRNGSAPNGSADNGSASNGKATMDLLATFGRTAGAPGVAGAFGTGVAGAGSGPGTGAGPAAGAGAGRSDGNPEWTKFTGSAIRSGDVLLEPGSTDFTWFTTDGPADPAGTTGGTERPGVDRSGVDRSGVEAHDAGPTVINVSPVGSVGSVGSAAAVNGVADGAAVDGLAVNGLGSNGAGSNGHSTNGRGSNGSTGVAGSTGRDPNGQTANGRSSIARALDGRAANGHQVSTGAHSTGVHPTGAQSTAAQSTGGHAADAQATTGQATSAHSGGAQPTGEPFTAVGLPRRVPQSHGVPTLAESPKTRQQPSTTRAPGKTAGHAAASQLNPARARGFLNDYQAGIRQGAHSRQEPEADNGTGDDADV
jgi:signal transduction histidine kinase